MQAQLILQVHDELIFEMPVDQVDINRAIIKKIMETAAYLSIPLQVNIGVGHHWDEAH